MFKESGFNPPVLEEKINGSIAERKVLGFQDDAGFFFLRKNPELRAEILKIAEIVVEKGGANLDARLGLTSKERTPEEKKKLAIALVEERFFEVNLIKNIENKNITIEGREPHKETEIDGLIKDVFSLRQAATQILKMADFNKEKNPDAYLENISTPFTDRLRSSLRERLSKKFEQSQIRYFPAIFENDKLKTHLDGIRGTDACLVVATPSDKIVFFLDYTADPEKAEDKSIIARGMGIKNQSSGELKNKDKKLLVYIDFDKVVDDANLAKMGDELAREIEKLV